MPDQAPQTTQGEELKELRKTFQSRALAVFRTPDGERVAYGWAWRDLRPLIQAELSKQREQARQEVLDELLNELPDEAVDVSDSHSLGYDTAIRETRSVINAKRKEDKKGD
jgi:hypothetical protein